MGYVWLLTRYLIDGEYLCSLNGLMRINLDACKFLVAQAVTGSFDLISNGLAICCMRLIKDFGQAVLGMDMYHRIVHTYPHGHTIII